MLPRQIPERATRNVQHDLQLALIELPAHVDAAAPRCARCDWPAAKRPKVAGYSDFCGGRRCKNPARACRLCAKAFNLGDEGAGTRYCSVDCRTVGYNEHSRTWRKKATKARPTQVLICAWCNGSNTSYYRRDKRKSWPFICAECTEPLSVALLSLKRHHVTHERARQLLTDPGCEICGIDLLVKVKTKAFTRVRMVVDHDHNCCPGTVSACGRCVRGLICVTCNAAIGLLRDSPATARSAAAYLDAWQAR